MPRGVWMAVLYMHEKMSGNDYRVNPVQKRHKGVDGGNSEEKHEPWDTECKGKMKMAGRTESTKMLFSLLLTLVNKLVLGERLFVVVLPCSQVRVRVRITEPITSQVIHEPSMVTKWKIYGNVLSNVGRGRKVRRITSDVLLIRTLVDAYVVDAHHRWECEVIIIDPAELFRYTEI